MASVTLTIWCKVTEYRNNEFEMMQKCTVMA